jgi:PKD repeat protein
MLAISTLNPNYLYGQMNECYNLIENPGFDLPPGSPPINGENAFYNELIPSWLSALGTPDYIYHMSWTDGFLQDHMCRHTRSSLFDLEDEFSAIFAGESSTGPWMEGVFQNLTAPLVANSEYQARLNLGRLPCEVVEIGTQIYNGIVRVYVGNGLINCNDFTQFCSNGGLSVQEVFTHSFGSLGELSFSFTPNQNYNQIAITLEGPENPGHELYILGVRLNELVLNCVSEQNLTINTTTNGMEVEFEVTTDQSGMGNSYIWDFGDGQTGTGATPTHTYFRTGGFDVCVTATDNTGCCVTECTTVSVDRSFGNNCPLPSGTYILDAFTHPAANNGQLRFSDLLAQGYIQTTWLSKYYINGVVVIDEANSHFLNEWYCDAGSSLVINVNNNNALAPLSIWGNTFQICDVMWRGIQLQSGNLQLTSCTINDAENGVFVGGRSIGANVSLRIDKNIFERNYRGVYFASSPSLSPYFFNQITLNRFRCNGTLATSYPGMPPIDAGAPNISRAGVEALGVGWLNLSLNGRINAGNIFQDLRNGLIARDVQILNVVGNEFYNMFSTNQNISFSDQDGIAVRTSNIHYAQIENNHAEDFKFGVFSISNQQNSFSFFLVPQIIVENNSFTNTVSNNSYSVLMRDYRFSNIRINQNSINGVTGAISNSIYLGGLNFSNLEVKHNMITLPTTSRCMTVVNCGSSTIAIEENTMNILPNSNISWGMLLFNNPNMLVRGNDIINITGGTQEGGLFKFMNIGSWYATVRDNHIQGFENSFEFSGAKDNLVCCNTGLVTRATGISQLLLKLNLLNLQLSGDNVRIGHQFHEKNTFIEKAEIIDASDVFFVAENNRFTVNPNIPGYKPSEILPVNVANIWFNDDTDEISIDSCTINTECEIVTIFEELTSGHNPPQSEVNCSIWEASMWADIVNGSEIGRDNTDHSDWEMRYHIYRHIDDHQAEFLNKCYTIDSFYTSSTDLKSWLDFEKSLEAVKEYQPVLDLLHAKSAYISASIQLLESIDGEDSTAVIPVADLDSLDAEGELIKDMEASAMNAWHGLMDDILDELDELPVPNDYTTLLKEMLTLHIGVVKDGYASLSTSDHDRIEEVAGFCERDYGRAVYLAKAMHLEISGNYIDSTNNSCDPLQERSKENIEQIAFDVSTYPNPNNGVFHIVLPQEYLYRDYELSIYNNVGQMVYSRVHHISESHFRLDVQALSTGVFTLELKDESSGNRAVNKIMIIR